mmetsp:Transcript_77267/g.202729  ORF Transcript_77267/g.202729 Transcript_77267/m.202729 type:complete len:222 (+) Transcript_77267:390-1055(+)
MLLASSFCSCTFSSRRCSPRALRWVCRVFSHLVKRLSRVSLVDSTTFCVSSKAALRQASILSRCSLYIFWRSRSCCRSVSWTWPILLVNLPCFSANFWRVSCCDWEMRSSTTLSFSMASSILRSFSSSSSCSRASLRSLISSARPLEPSTLLLKSLRLESTTWVTRSMSVDSLVVIPSRRSLSAFAPAFSLSRTFSICAARFSACSWSCARFSACCSWRLL